MSTDQQIFYLSVLLLCYVIGVFSLQHPSVLSPQFPLSLSSLICKYYEAFGYEEAGSRTSLQLKLSFSSSWLTNPHKSPFCPNDQKKMKAALQQAKQTPCRSDGSVSHSNLSKRKSSSIFLECVGRGLVGGLPWAGYWWGVSVIYIYPIIDTISIETPETSWTSPNTAPCFHLALLKFLLYLLSNKETFYVTSAMCVLRPYI